MKVTDIKQLFIKYFGGGEINIPPKYLKTVKIKGKFDGQIDNADEEETDSFKKYLKEFATQKMSEGVSFAHIFGVNSFDTSALLFPKSSFDEEIKPQLEFIGVSLENAIGDKDDYSFVVINMPNVSSGTSLPEEDYLIYLLTNSEYIFLNNENFGYITKSFIKRSLKEYMIYSLYGCNFYDENLNKLGTDINYTNLEERVAIDNIKFYIPSTELVLDDLDLSLLPIYATLSNQITVLFDENETKHIYLIDIEPASFSNYIEFYFDTQPHAQISTSVINGKTYKFLNKTSF